MKQLYNLSKKISGLINNYETPQDVYTELTYISNSQKDYFNILGPENMIKLVFYIFSLKTTNDFILGKKLLDNISFAELIITENKLHTYSCNICGGEGTVPCDSCDEVGYIECDYCDGSGIHDGEDCDNCGGDGDYICQDCYGRGNLECYECDGIGEIVSEDEIIFDRYFILTWNDKLKNIFELRENTPEPSISEETFIDHERDIITLHISDYQHGELELIENNFYCVHLSDTPKLKFTPRMEIKFN